MIEFQFKGNRNYVHGTDMVNSYLNIFTDCTTIEAQIVKLTSKQLAFSTKKEGGVVAIFQSGDKNGKNIKRYLVETDLPVQGRYVFDEAALVLNSTIQDYSITMYSNSSFSPIENIVALNKRLLNKTISSKAKWLFVGIKLFVIPKPKESDIYRLEVEKRLGTKLIISSIMLNDTLIGTIKFSSK